MVGTISSDTKDAVAGGVIAIAFSFTAFYWISNMEVDTERYNDIHSIVKNADEGERKELNLILQGYMEDGKVSTKEAKSFSLEASKLFLSRN